MENKDRMTKTERQLMGQLARKDKTIRTYALRIEQLEAQVKDLLHRMNGNGAPPAEAVAPPPVINSTLHARVKTPILIPGNQPNLDFV